MQQVIGLCLSEVGRLEASGRNEGVNFKQLRELLAQAQEIDNSIYTEIYSLHAKRLSGKSPSGKSERGKSEKKAVLEDGEKTENNELTSSQLTKLKQYIFKYTQQIGKIIETRNGGQPSRPPGGLSNGLINGVPKKGPEGALLDEPEIQNDPPATGPDSVSGPGDEETFQKIRKVMFWVAKN